MLDGTVVKLIDTAETLTFGLLCRCQFNLDGGIQCVECGNSSSNVSWIDKLNNKVVLKKKFFIFKHLLLDVIYFYD